MLLALAALAAPGSPQADAATGSSWPRCDECEAVVTQMGPPPHIPTPHASPNRVLTAALLWAGRAFDRQRKPKRRGGGLRELQGGELEELLEDEICEPELFRGTHPPPPHA